MRQRLKAKQSGWSPERALSLLRTIQHHRITLNNTQPVSGIPSINQEQAGIFSALTIKKPASDKSLALL